MQLDIDKITIPPWLVDLLIAGGADNSKNKNLSRILLPSLYSHELDHLVHLLGILQAKVLQNKDALKLTISKADVENAFPSIPESDRVGLERILFSMPALRLKNTKGQSCSIYDIRFDADDIGSISINSNSMRHLCGFEDYYSSSLQGEDLKAPVVINFDLYRKLELNERRFYLALLRSMSHSLALQKLGKFRIEQSEFINFEMSDWEQLKRIAHRFSDKVFRLGYLKYPLTIHEDGYFHIDHSPEFHIQDNADLQHSIAKLSFVTRSTEEVYKLAKNFAGRELSAAEMRGLNTLTECLRSKLAELHGGLPVENGLLLNIPLLFIEWSLRNSPFHGRQLPEEIRKSLFGEICYLTHENLIANYTQFHRILRYDGHVRNFVGSNPLCYGKIIVNNSDSVVEQNEKEVVLPNLKESVFLTRDENISPPVDLGVEEQVNESPGTEKLLTQKIEGSQGKNFEAMNIVKSELNRMKKYSIGEYKELRERYLQSLSPVDQKILADIAARMRKDVFDQQMEKRLLRYMIANPGAWQAGSGSRLLGFRI